MREAQRLSYVHLLLGSQFLLTLSPPPLFFFFNSQPYVAVSPTAFRQPTVGNILRFDRTIHARVLRLARQTHILDEFVDFDDHLEDRRVPFLTNGAVQAALNAPPR
jgi:hypothetical protein